MEKIWGALFIIFNEMGWDEDRGIKNIPPHKIKISLVDIKKTTSPLKNISESQKRIN
jgi:hypothetical protein